MPAPTSDQQGREILVDETQRDAERAALRNVRKTLNAIQNAEDDKRKLFRIVLSIVIVLVLVLAWFIVALTLK